MIFRTFTEPTRICYLVGCCLPYVCFVVLISTFFCKLLTRLPSIWLVGHFSFGRWLVFRMAAGCRPFPGLHSYKFLLGFWGFFMGFPPNKWRSLNLAKQRAQSFLGEIPAATGSRQRRPGNELRTLHFTHYTLLYTFFTVRTAVKWGVLIEEEMKKEPM